MKSAFFILLALLEAGTSHAAGGICESTFQWVESLDWPQEEKLRFFANAAPEKIGNSKHEDDVRFVELTKQPESQNLIFLHVTLKPLKELNDKIFDAEDTAGKNDVDSARNMFRVFFFENLKANKMLAPGLIAQFHNFKSGEPALDTTKIIDPRTGHPYGPSYVKAQIDAVWVQSQMQFSQFMIRLATEKRQQALQQPELLRKPDLLQRMMEQGGLVSDFTSWHLLGMSYGSADRAAVAARQAAKLHNKEIGMPLKAHLFNEQELRAHLFEAERKHKKLLVDELGANSPVFTRYEQTEDLVLSPRAIDLLRSVKAADKDEYIAVVKKRFKESLDTMLTPDQAIALRDYFAASDDFQPAIRSMEQGKIYWDQAKAGAFSIDFAGLNVTNMYHTMGAMAEANRLALGGAQDSARTAIALARRGEKRATDRLRYLRETFDEARKRAGIEGEYQMTGDDGAIILKKMPNENQRKAFYRELRALGATLGDYRIVWVPPTGNGDTMSKESVKGENFEKRLRQAVFLHLKEKVGTEAFERLKRSGIAIEMIPDEKKFGVMLATEDAAVESAVREVLKNRQLYPPSYALSSFTLGL